MTAPKSPESQLQGKVDMIYVALLEAVQRDAERFLKNKSQRAKRYLEESLQMLKDYESLAQTPAAQGED